MKRVLITGSNRGFGLEFTRQYLESGWRVYATCKRPTEAESLKLLEKIHSGLSVHRLDVTVQEDISNIVRELGHIKLDILINNASVDFKRKKESIESVDYDNWRRAFEVNTLGSVRVTEALLENVAGLDEGNGVIVTISSSFGAFDDMTKLSGTTIYYRSSKAALNAAMLSIAMELRAKNIGVLLMTPDHHCPGSENKESLSQQERVQGMRQVIENFSMKIPALFFTVMVGRRHGQETIIQGSQKRESEVETSAMRQPFGLSFSLLLRQQHCSGNTSGSNQPREDHSHPFDHELHRQGYENHTEYS